jgi:hypothetical protein
MDAHRRERKREPHFFSFPHSSLISAHITPISTPRHAIAIASTHREKKIPFPSNGSGQMI